MENLSLPYFCTHHVVLSLKRGYISTEKSHVLFSLYLLANAAMHLRQSVSDTDRGEEKQSSTVGWAVEN